MSSRTYVQMYIETGRYHYIVKNRSHYVNALIEACQYLDNHPEKVEEVVMCRVRFSKLLTRSQRTPCTSFQWLFLELQIINSWIWDEQFSGDVLSIVPLTSEKSTEPDFDKPNPIYTPKHIQHRKRGRR